MSRNVCKAFFARSSIQTRESGIADERRYATPFHKSLLHADKPLAYFKL
jgi:hypothetical protein